MESNRQGREDRARVLLPLMLSCISCACRGDKQWHTLKGDTAELILRVMKKMEDMDCQMVIHLCGEGFIGNSTECNVV